MITRINVILMRLVAVLLTLVLISTAIVSGRFARYTTTASGEDSARVARFLIRNRDLNDPMFENFSTDGMSPGDSRKIAVLVDVKSEIAFRYTLTVNRPYADLPLVVSLNPDGSDPATVFTDIVPAGKDAQFSVYVVWPQNFDSKKYIGRVDNIEFVLRIEQVD